MNVIGTSAYNNQIFTMLGQGGTGKTSLLKHFLGLSLSNNNKKIILFMPNDFLDYELNYARLLLEDEIPASKIGSFLKKEIRQDGEKELFIDEVDMLPFTEDLDYVFRFARNHKTNIYSTAKSTADINKLIVRQSHRLYIFFHHEENDLKRLKNINTKLYNKVPELQVREAYVLEGRKLIDKIRLELEYDKLEKFIKDNLKSIEEERYSEFQDW